MTHYHDPVPHVPPSFLFGFQHANEEVWYDEGSQTYVSCPQPEQSNCANQISLLQYNIEDHTSYLNFNQKAQTSLCST